jgi:hypothetical protein
VIANIDITLITLLENKKIMFDLIDNADSNNSKAGDEFPIILYTRLLTTAMHGKSESEKSKLYNILSLESLDRNQLLACLDTRAGIFIFQPYVISMFRHLEGHRLEELSDAELNGLHNRLKGIYRSVVAVDDLDVEGGETLFPWDPESQDYREELKFIISTFREINSRIDQNVLALKAQAKTLSELADQDESASMLRTEQVYEALKSIYDLVERYIKPNLEFLNPDIEWRGNKNESPLYLFKQIMDRFGARLLNKERSMMGRIYQNLIHAAEEITVVRKSLDIYINLYEHERRLYNAIETRYNYFYQKVSDLKDGKLNRQKLDPSTALFKGMNNISGIKTHISGQKSLINFPGVMDTSFLDEHLRVSLVSVVEQKAKLVDVELLPPKDNLQDVKERARFNLLFEAAKAIAVQPSKDLYEQIHDALHDNLEGYTLADIIDAYNIVDFEDVNVDINLTEKKQLKFDGGVLTYYPRLLQGNQ